MRTETKLRLSVAASLLISVAVFYMIFAALHNLDREAVRGRTYQDIQNKVHALTVTALRAQDLPDPTVLHQIRQLRASLDLLLGAMTFADAREGYFVGQIRTNARALGSALEQLIAGALGPEDEMREQRQALLFSQLSMKTQFIADDTQQLVRISRQRIADERRFGIGVITTLVILLILSNAAISYFTGRSILRMQKGLRQALAQAEQGDRLLSALMEQVPEGISIADREFNLIRVSRYGRELQGSPEKYHSVAESHQKWDFRQADGITPLPYEQMPLVRAVRQGEVVKDLEIVGFNAQGKRIPLLCSAGPIRDAGGDIIGAIVAWRDITQIKQAEEQLQQARKLESIGRLAGGVAHDFNNKLSIILGNAELALASGPLPPAVRGFLTEIQEAARLSADLTYQLLSFARKQMIAPQVLDLNASVEGTLKMLRRLIGEQIHLIWLPGFDTWPIHMDPSQLDQILSNLCTNARDAIDGEGVITLKTCNQSIGPGRTVTPECPLPGDYAVLSVSDNGRGMDDETKAQIFEPFFTTKGLSKGTGLGLPMIYGIVKQNHGFIEVTSTPGKGATITIYLPRHGGAKNQPIMAEPAESAPGARETLLVVEDEPALLDMSKVMLEKLGYRVLAAAAPGQALQLAQAENARIDLLVTDVIMPEMNGRELAQRLRSTHPGIGVVYLSGYTADAIARHGILEPGVHFLQKPFMIKELAEKVREALDGG